MAESVDFCDSRGRIELAMRTTYGLVLALALLVPVMGCPGDDTTDTGADSGNVATSMSTSTSMSTGDGTADGESTASTVPGLPGVCLPTCEMPEDCGDPADFECTDGVCIFIGQLPPCVIADCDPGVCALIDGVDTCTFPCTPGGDQCDAFPMLACDGADDNGTMICTPPPCFGAAELAPCEIPNLGGAIGNCVNSECVCTSDDQCTADGYACDN